ncbi:MAG: aminotransferase class I/II-fold pyridoxal phosphate-dependent enzyme [Myxococcus sp.]|nr:aminotransferase class I/II-fold pyridoxal phosphate-dependent enzyme [Myxococcus sp.]
MRPFALERYLSKHEFSVRHLACASDPDTMRLDEVLALDPTARDRLLGMSLGYTETKGAPALRAAIARRYCGIEPDDVLVHVGAEEPIFTFFRSTLQPGDHVIVLTPTYQSLTSVAEALGATVSRWDAREADGWQPDPAELEALVTPKTKVLAINTPQNPTGGLLSADRFEAVCDFAAKHGLWLLGDEVYRGLEHGGPALPSVAEASARGVGLGAMAKVYGLAGLRIGWAVSRDRSRLSQMEAVKDFLSICAPGPSELLATVALEHADVFRLRALATVRSNVSLIEGLLEQFPRHLSWSRPLAGTTGFLRVLEEPASAWSQRLLDETGVLLAPSLLFDWPDTHVRVGLGRASLGAAMGVLSTWLERQ